MIRPVHCALAALLMMQTPLPAPAQESAPAGAPAERGEAPLDPRITPETLAAFEARTYEGADGFRLPYRLLKPRDAEAGRKYPLVLFLHGYGERGADNQRQLIHGGAAFASDEFRRARPSFVVAPQCPDTNDPETGRPDVWTNRLDTQSSPTTDVLAAPTRQLAAALAVVRELVANESVDADRLYVCGLSMGGYATWELAAREPGLWAAAVPICGGGDPSTGARMATLPIWAQHGDSDNVVPPERSREMIGAILAAGGRPILTEYPGVGHDSWSPTFASRHVWDWVFAQHR